MPVSKCLLVVVVGVVAFLEVSPCGYKKIRFMYLSACLCDSGGMDTRWNYSSCCHVIGSPKKSAASVDSRVCWVGDVL